MRSLLGGRLTVLAAAAGVTAVIGSAESAARGSVVQVSQASSGEPRIVAARSGGQLVVWISDEAGYNRLWGRMVGIDGEPEGPEFEIAEPAADGVLREAFSVDVAVRGSRDEFLVVWTQAIAEPEGTDAEIVARRVGGDGALLSDVFVVAPSEAFPHLSSAAVSYGGQRREFVIVWAAARESAGFEIHGVRIQAGSTHVPAPRQVSSMGARADDESPRALSPEMAYDPRHDRHLVLWHGKGRDLPRHREEVYGCALPARPGAGCGRTRRLSGFETESVGGVVSPLVAFNPRTREFAMTWKAAPRHDDPRFYARRIRPDGRPLGPETTIVEPGPPDGFGLVTDIAAAPNGRYTVAYEVRRGREGSVAYARRLRSGLRPRGAYATRISSGDIRRRAFSPSIAYSRAESRFRAAWLEGPAPMDGPAPIDGSYEVFTRGL
jgi:hypothetical protein